MLTEQILFRTPVLTVSDVRCRVTSRHCAGEEYATGRWIVLPRRGSFVKHVGTRTLVADPAHVLFFNQGETFRVSHPIGDGDDCTVFEFSDSVLADAAPRLDGRDAPSFGLTHVLVSPRAQLLHQRLRAHLERPHRSTLAIEEDSVLLLHRILRDPRERSSATPGRPAGSIRTLRDLVDAARLELLAAPGETHSLTPLAHKLGMSPFHLARRFRRELGLPVHQYLLRLRLALALDRIRDGATGFSRLAWELGFSSHSHFSATFRTTYGMTPTEAAQGLAPGNDR